MDNFAQALAAVRTLKEEGVVSEYAVGGAMALVFWSEPAATFDLDVFVLLEPEGGPLVSLEKIYAWARQRGYPEKDEHIIVAGVPVQVLPTHSALAEEAVANAATLTYEGQPIRVMRPEYLVALCLEPEARTFKRLARVGGLLEEGGVDRKLLNVLLERYNLELPNL